MIRLASELERRYLRAMGISLPWLVRVDHERLEAAISHAGEQHGHHETDEELQARAIARLMAEKPHRSDMERLRRAAIVGFVLLALLILATRLHAQNPGPHPAPSGGPGGATAWGSITGTLASQTDLNSALAAKASSSASTTVNGQPCGLGLSCTVADATKVPTGTATWPNTGTVLTDASSLAGAKVSGNISGSAASITGSITKSQVSDFPALGSLAAKSSVDYSTSDVANKPALGTAAAQNTTAFDASGAAASAQAASLPLHGKADTAGAADTAVTLATGADRTKLDGIAAGATVGADWNTNVANKPTLAATKAAVAGSPLLSYDSTTGAFTQGALTAANVGAVPTTRTVAGKGLSGDITIACADLSDDGAGCTAAWSITNPVIDGTANPGVGTTMARGDHVHPTDTGRAASNASTTVNGQTCTLGSTCTVSDSAAAPKSATYITQTADGTLSAEQALSGLSTGIVKVTTGTGVLSTAIAADFPTLNQSTSGTAANLSGTPTLPNGTLATTQTASDNSTKLATTAYVDAANERHRQGGCRFGVLGALTNGAKMKQDERRRLENQLMMMGLSRLDEAALIPQMAMLIKDHEFYQGMLGECDADKRVEMYEALRPHLSFTPKPLDEYIAEVKRRASAAASRGEPITVGDKTYMEVAPADASEVLAEVTCYKCTRTQTFSGRTPVEAAIAARSAGWVRDLTVQKEICPKCPAIRTKFATA